MPRDHRYPVIFQAVCSIPFVRTLALFPLLNPKTSQKKEDIIINHFKKLTWTWSFNKLRKFHYHTSKLRNGIRKMILHLQSHIWYSNKILKNILLTSLVRKNLCLSISEVWEGSMKVFSRMKCCYRDEYFGQIYQSKIVFIFRQLHLHFCKTWR